MENTLDGTHELNSLQDWINRVQAERNKIFNVYLDFEFNRSEQRELNLVCLSIRMFGETRNFWLHNDPRARRILGRELSFLWRQARFVCYGAIAESRALAALGMDVINGRFIDLFAEATMLQNENDVCTYGRYFDKMGNECCSVPPHRVPSMNIGKDMRPIGKSLVDSCALYLGVNVSAAVKDQMRRLILEDRPEYTQEQQQDIMRYCASDVVHLPALWSEMSNTILELMPEDYTPEMLLEHQETRGMQAVSMGICESEGIPIDIEACLNLNSNVEAASDEAITSLVENCYPFFVKDKDGEWKQKQDKFDDFVNSSGVAKKWPKTGTGKYKSDDDTLDKFENIKEIKELRSTRKTLKNLAWFRDEAWDSFYRSVDIRDHRLRCWLKPFGTQSNRNAPPSSRFIPAMSNWLRALIRAPKGWAITGIDWSSQEFMIGAVLSKDPKMMSAYLSGDPYVGFAQEAGAIPRDVNKKWVKNPDLAPEDQRDEYRKHKDTRDLFKATVLGLQYGMGADSLASKLTEDTGRLVTVQEATRLKNLHKKVFCVYWAWLDKYVAEYQTRPAQLWDGWTMFQDNTNGLSVKNVPTQGGGSVMMRRAVIMAQRKGLKIVFPLHDAIYVLHPIGSTAEIELLDKIMAQAVTDVLGEGVVIRTEAKTFTHDDTWLEDKGKKMFALLGKYLQPRWLTKDQEEALKEKRERELHEKENAKPKKPRASKEKEAEEEK